MDNTKQEREKPRSDPEAATTLMHSMERHWKEATSTGEIAQQAYLSRFHFQRTFRDNTGETPGRMRRRLLLERAACDLRITEKSVTDIALEANYRSLEGFGRAFKTAFRLSPQAYRRTAQQIRLLPGTSGVHYDPQSRGTYSTLLQGKRNMDLIDSLLESDYQSKRILFEQANLLTDAQLDARLAFRFFVQRWEEPAETLRASLVRMERDGWVDSLFRSVNFTPTDDTYRHLQGTAVPDMQRRFESYHEAFRTFVRKVRDENLWDTEWIDADCTPPETFTIGGVIEESLSESIAYRRILHRQMEQYGFKVGTHF